MIDLRNELLLTWTEIKDFCQDRSAKIQYIDKINSYILIAFDGNYLVWCKLIKNSPEQSSDIADFEANFKTTANQKINENTYSNSNLNVNAELTVPDSGLPIAYTDGQLDAFGRLRTAEIHNVFESTHVNTDQSEFWDKLESGTTKSITHVPLKSCVDLTVGTESGNRALRQTMNYFHYAAGESLLIRLTGVLGNGETNLTTLCGYGDDDNGLFFTVKDGVFGIIVRTDTSGSPVDEFIPQSTFNVDTLDGNGNSGITIDLSKTQIFQVDIQWLGVGTCRFSVHIGGQQITFHKYNQNANIKDKVYMRSPHLPIRYEIKTTGTTTQTNTLSQICTQVSNEGKSLVGDLVRAIDMDTNFTTIRSNSFDPIISFRLNPTYAKTLIAFISFNYVVTTNDDVLFRLIIDGNVSGGTWIDVDGLAQIKTPTSVSGGTLMGANYVSKTGRTDAGEFSSKFRLGTYIDGTPQTITVVAKSFSGLADVGCAILYKELF